MRDLVRAPVRVSEAEALESYLNEKSFAVLTYVEVKPAFVARYATTPVTDAEVETWAKKAENATIVESTVELRKKEAAKDGNIRHILARVSPTDGEKEHAQALAKITEAYARIERGEPFADVARALSDDSTKTKGGSLETEKTDSFVPSFKAATDALKNGEMTKTAIESQFGYHIIMKDDSSRLAKDVARELYYEVARRRRVEGSRDAHRDGHEGRQVGRRRDQAGNCLAQADPVHQGDARQIARPQGPGDDRRRRRGRDRVRRGQDRRDGRRGRGTREGDGARSAEGRRSPAGAHVDVDSTAAATSFRTSRWPTRASSSTSPSPRRTARRWPTR